ncbi:hypothetical protein ACTXT7_011966 [Hymenolepis weldensis]
MTGVLRHRDNTSIRSRGRSIVIEDESKEILFWHFVNVMMELQTPYDDALVFSAVEQLTKETKQAISLTCFILAFTHNISITLSFLRIYFSPLSNTPLIHLNYQPSPWRKVVASC